MLFFHTRCLEPFPPLAAPNIITEESILLLVTLHYITPDNSLSNIYTESPNNLQSFPDSVENSIIRSTICSTIELCTMPTRSQCGWCPSEDPHQWRSVHFPLSTDLRLGPQANLFWGICSKSGGFSRIEPFPLVFDQSVNRGKAWTSIWRCQ